MFHNPPKLYNFFKISIMIETDFTKNHIKVTNDHDNRILYNIIFFWLHTSHSQQEAWRPPSSPAPPSWNNFFRVNLSLREGHGAMVRAWRSADVAVCRAVSNPVWCRIFREISCFSPLNIGTLLNVLCFGKALHPQMLHLTQVKMCTW